MTGPSSRMIWTRVQNCFCDCFCNIRMHDSKTVHWNGVIFSHKMGSSSGLVLFKDIKSRKSASDGWCVTSHCLFYYATCSCTVTSCCEDCHLDK